MDYGASFTCTATINIPGVLTLNGLSAGYQPAIVSAGYASAPGVASCINGISSPTDIPGPQKLFEAYGGYENVYMGGGVDCGYTITVSYNLPDGTLLVIDVDVAPGNTTSTSLELKSAIPQISNPNGESVLFMVTDAQTGGSASDGFTLSFTLTAAG